MPGSTPPFTGGSATMTSSKDDGLRSPMIPGADALPHEAFEGIRSMRVVPCSLSSSAKNMPEGPHEEIRLVVLNAPGVYLLINVMIDPVGVEVEHSALREGGEGPS